MPRPPGVFRNDPGCRSIHSNPSHPSRSIRPTSLRHPWRRMLWFRRRLALHRCHSLPIPLERLRRRILLASRHRWCGLRRYLGHHPHWRHPSPRRWLRCLQSLPHRSCRRWLVPRPRHRCCQPCRRSLCYLQKRPSHHRLRQGHRYRRWCRLCRCCRPRRRSLCYPQRRPPSHRLRQSHPALRSGR